MALARKDEPSANAIRNAIDSLFDGAVERIVVGSTEGPEGEPAFYATVYMKAGQKRVSGARLIDTIEAASAALRELEDFRFPYVTFLAPEDEYADEDEIAESGPGR